MIRWKHTAFSFLLLFAGAFAAHQMKGDQVYSLDFSSLSPEEEALRNEAAMGLLESMIGTTERANKINRLMSPAPPTSAAATSTGLDCEECRNSRIESVRYKECSPSNDYLEPTLSRMREGNSLQSVLMSYEPTNRSFSKDQDEKGKEFDTRIKVQCVRAAMDARFSEKNRSFRQCSGGRASIRAYRPCVSDNYFRLIHNSFNLVSRCLLPMDDASQDAQREDLRAMYGLTTIESGFHLNAVSGTGAGGVGQFTGVAIDDVNKNMLGKIREQLDAQGGACSQLKDLMFKNDPPMRRSTKQSCDRISAERGHPLIGFAYSYAYLAINKKTIKRSVLDNKRHTAKFAKLPPQQRARIESSLATWAHNTGAGAMNSAVLTTLNAMYRGRLVTDADQFLKDIGQAMISYPSRSMGTARRKETREYFPRILSTMKQIEQNAGGGSCVR